MLHKTTSIASHTSPHGDEFQTNELSHTLFSQKRPLLLWIYQGNKPQMPFHYNGYNGKWIPCTVSKREVKQEGKRMHPKRLVQGGCILVLRRIEFSQALRFFPARSIVVDRTLDVLAEIFWKTFEHVAGSF